MNLESMSIGHSDVPSALLEQSSEMIDLDLTGDQLDQPLFLTQDTRHELPPLSSGTRERLGDSGWSDEILDAIGSEAEACIYEDADLEMQKVGQKDALVRTDIDYDRKDPLGQTNLERMEDGRPPLDSRSGRPIELHHIGQKPDSPLAELTQSEHRGNGNDNILHNKMKESEIDRTDFSKEREQYWKARAEEIRAQR